MTAYYEEIMKLWKEGNFFDAISYFDQWISKGFLNEQEVGGFNKNLSKFWEFIEVECEGKAEVMLSLYEMLKKARNWDDETLCKKLEISDEAIEDLKNRHKPRSEGMGLKMLYQLFPQMAV